MTKDDMIKMMENARTISGFILTPSVSSLKNVSRPALEAGMGALFFLLLIGAAFCGIVLKPNVGKNERSVGRGLVNTYLAKSVFFVLRVSTQG